VLLGVAFVPLRLEFVAWFAFVPLLWALNRAFGEGRSLRSLFGIGYAGGFVFYLIGTHWIAQLAPIAITVPWLKYPAWVAAAAYLALFTGLMTLLVGVLVRHAGMPLAWAFPPAALVVEELRASGELGFPWFQPGYTQHAFVPLLTLASLGSVTLVTLWVFALNALAWVAVSTRGRAVTLAFAVVLAAPWIVGAWWIGPPRPPSGPAVALIQGDIPGEIKWEGRHQQQILDTFLSLSDRAAHDPEKPRVIVWPETATGSYLSRQLDQALQVVAFAARAGVSVFSGFAHYEIGSDGKPRYLNAAGMFRPDGSSDPVYGKRHLVPFGERMPFQALIPALGRIDLGQAEWTPGKLPVLFEGGTGKFGCLICFESIFPDLAREDVRRGATWLVNITNDEWFGRSVALDQHAAMAVFRAAENHVPLARCANTGITMMVDSFGRVVASAPTWESSVLVARLDAPRGRTLFTAVGDWPGMVCSLIVAVQLVIAARRALTPRVRRT